MHESTWYEIRDWAIAAGTVGATAAALYIGVWREWWRRPKLSIEYHGGTAGDAVEVGIGATNPNTKDVATHVRLRVLARSGRTAAGECEGA